MKVEVNKEGGWLVHCVENGLNDLDRLINRMIDWLVGLLVS
jgi:hypothetical protein